MTYPGASSTPRLETSSQQLPSLAETVPPLAPSQPLHGLAEAAWQLDHSLCIPENIPFPFSNDECTAPYVKQLSVREQSPDYRTATNRVALLIGESALAANLADIPEDTIVLFDKSPDMCTYMGETYVQQLREAASARAWRQSVLRGAPERYYRLFAGQLVEWRGKGYEHPLSKQARPETFLAAQQAAREKAIIPWFGDITEPLDLQILGDALRAQNATVTFMNLSNVIPACHKFDTAQACADALGQLPVSRYAPILTTQLHARKPQNALEERERLRGRSKAEATGPFFGLANLATGGLVWSRNNPGSVNKRQYAPETSAAPEPAPPGLGNVALHSTEDVR
jgi:hypothetical protein